MKLNPHIRFYGLLFITALVYVLAYQFAFKQSMIVNKENKQLEKQLSNADSLPMLISQLDKKILQIDRKTGKDSLSAMESGLQQQTIDFVTTHNTHVRLEEVAAPMFSETDNYASEIIMLKLSGSYPDLLQLLYSLEFSSVNGRLISSNFESVNLIQEKQKKLYLTLYMQHIKWKGPLPKK